MATIHLHQRTTATPEQFIAGLTDFGPGRSKIFGNSADEYLKVHDHGATRGRRHRGLGRHLGTPALRLVGSEPHRHDDDRLQPVGRKLGPHLHLHAQPDGTTDLDAVVVRDGKNLKGRMLGAIVGTIGKGHLAKAMDNTVKAVEARSQQSSPQ